MSKISDFYYVRGQEFHNENYKPLGKPKAIHYCRVNGISEDEIYELSNNVEREFLEALLKRDDIYEIKSHEEVCLVGQFVNSSGETIPNYMFQTSFTYREEETNKVHFIFVANNQYKITKELALAKTLFDKELAYCDCCLEVYYQDENKNFKEWHIGDNAVFIQARKEERKQRLAQKKEIRDRQRFDRLLKLRSEGKITETQTQELYKLEKVYGGNNG